MKAKRIVYSVLLILFSLILLADLALWFLLPEEPTAAEGEASLSFTPPEGGTAEKGGASAEGMTFPAEGEGRPNRPARGDRAARADEGAGTGEGSGRETRSAEAPETDEPETVLDLLLTRAQPLWPYRLHILIAAALGMGLCLLRLIFLNRAIRRQQPEQEPEPASLRRVVLWPAFGLLLGALVLVVILFPVNEEEDATDGAVANVRLVTGTVEEKTLTNLIQSAGYLEEQETTALTVPASVSVASVCVKNGDAVTAGQIVAKADEASVMKAIASVHEALSAIDAQLQKAHDSKGVTSLTAPVAGTVKEVYASVGETALDVMNEHGSLMLLSLDGRMAVQVSAGDDLVIGSPLVVILPDGSELSGETAYLEEGVATVTVVDRGYAIGEQVSVKTPDGALLGSGPLYVHKALNITGYLGTVVRVYRSEGSTVYGGATLIGLSDTADLADYTSLLQQRAEYEAELKTLFELLDSGYIHAPCDGVIANLSDDLAYLPLADMAAGLTVRHLASGPADGVPEDYVHYIGEVLENAGGLLSLRAGASPVSVSSYTSLPAMPAATMTGTFTIPGSAPIYRFSGGWNTITVGDILVGDKILFTFDAAGSLVFVIVEPTAASATPTPTPTPTPSPSPTPDGSAGPEESPAPSSSPGQGGSHGGHSGGSSGISFRIPTGGGTGASSARKTAYTIAEKELCTVTPQEKMLITVPIDELDILSVHLGQEADLYLDALPTMGFSATVTKVEPEGENSGGNTKFSVTLSLDRAPQLYPGMNGTVCFPRGEERTVPAVPLAALEEAGNRTLVYTAYDEETEQLLSPVEVQTGISDGTDVEILSGLRLGDPYCYRYADSISYVTE